MSTAKALISARPWTDSGAIKGLFSAASAAKSALGGQPVRVLPEQLARLGPTGDRQQSIRIEIGEFNRPVDHGSAVQHEEDLGRHDIDMWGIPEGQVNVDLTGLAILLGGKPIEPIEVEKGPRGSFRVFIPSFDAPVDVELMIPSLDAVGSIPFTVPPVRDWTIHLVHHSHFDIGYTDPQSVVLAQQRSFLDSALDLLRSTEDDPEETRFRWVVESIFNFEDWAATRPPHIVDEFVDYVRRGRAEISALPYNLHTDTCSTDELHELLRAGREIAERYGIKLLSAMQTDVPGTVGGLPDALAENGVKYLSVAHNWAGRSTPQVNGGQLLPRLFRWAGPSGESVLVWLTDSPHGLAYMEGPLLGFHHGYSRVEDNLPIYLTSLATNPYPFPPGVFGWHGTAQAVDREPYPWDIVHLRTQGYVGDNAPARLMASNIAKEWNSTWTSPKIVVSTNTKFFEDAAERLDGQIKTYEGDWGDWWVEGVGSAAYPMALVREAQARVTDAQTVAGIRAIVSGAPIPGDAAESASVYRTISMFNEHTWGSGNSWRYADHGFDSGEVQWQWKVAHAIQSQQQAGQYLERASAYLGGDVGVGAGATASYYVVNTTALRRDTTARFFVRESTVPFGTDFVVRDGRSGERLPVAEERQWNHEHRESGRFVTVSVPSVPSVGLVRLDLFTGAVIIEEAEASVERDVTEIQNSLMLENEHLRVRVNLRSASISSIVEVATGREVLNTDSLFGGNEYIYDLYTSAGGFNHQSNKTSTSDELELLGDRRRARPAALISRVSDAVEERLVYEYPAPGVDSVRVTLRLRHGEPFLIVENRIAKPPTDKKESAFFAFPFAGNEPTVRYEISGGVTGDGLDHVPGAPQHMRAVRNWVTVESDAGSIAWVTKDAPLVERGTIALPYAPFPASTSPYEPGTIISWLHNNVWDTNFPVQQGFETTFAFAIGVTGSVPASTEAIALATTAALVSPVVVVQATGGPNATAPAERSLLSLDDARVKLVSVQSLDERRILVRLQSFANESVTVALSADFLVSSAAAATFLGEERGAVPIEDGLVSVTIPRLSVSAVILYI